MRKLPSRLPPSLSPHPDLGLLVLRLGGEWSHVLEVGLLGTRARFIELWHEVIELPAHPFFIASQFHPEFLSKPNRPHPLFWEHEGNRAVRSGNWKIVSLYREPWELYAHYEDGHWSRMCTDPALQHVGSPFRVEPPRFELLAPAAGAAGRDLPDR